MKLSQLQQQILDCQDKKIIVMASAAGGKTTVMTEKVRDLLTIGIAPQDIAVITFTNMAATELRHRLGSDYREGLFVGTIHSLANYMLTTAGIKTDKVLDNEQFDKLFDMVEKNPGCIKHFSWVLLDEAQDTDEKQFEFLLNMINPDNFFFMGDNKQSIYGWRGSRPDLLCKLCERPDVTVLDLNENYRNGANILAYAKNLISPTGLRDNSIALRPHNGTVTEMSLDFPIIIKRIKDNPPYKEWAILARTNKDIELVASFFKKENVPFDTFKQGDLSKDELTQRLNQDTVKVLTVHSAKGLEWDNVVVIGMRYNEPEERRICYVAATRARESLIWTKKTSKRKTAAPRKSIIYDW